MLPYMVLMKDLQLQLQYRDQHAKAPPQVVYAHLKYMWANNAREESFNYLRSFAAGLSRDLQSEHGDHSQRVISKQKLNEFSHLLARLYFKQGQWQVALKDDWGSVCFRSIIITIIH